MTEKEIISEMAKYLQDPVCMSKLQAKTASRKLYDKGYRKIPEGAVVLTREDYNRIRSKERQVIDLESIMKAEEQARKETAREFAKKIKALLEDCSMFENVDIEQLEFDGEAIKEILYETAKQFGVEMEE